LAELKTKKTSKQKVIDLVKANKKGLRDAQLESSPGFAAVDKIHKSKKAYKRIKIKKTTEEGD
jgi:hypothetical protein